MSSILPFLSSDVAFDDATTRAMAAAFDAACKDLHDKGQPAIVREIMASRIIEAATRGECDVERLRNVAISAVLRARK
jgi:hypothetical protein